MTQETSRSHRAWGRDLIQTVTVKPGPTKRSKADRAVWTLGYALLWFVGMTLFLLALDGLRRLVGDLPVNIVVFGGLIGYIGWLAWKRSDR